MPLPSVNVNVVDNFAHQPTSNLPFAAIGAVPSGEYEPLYYISDEKTARTTFKEGPLCDLACRAVTSGNKTVLALPVPVTAVGAVKSLGASSIELSFSEFPSNSEDDSEDLAVDSEASTMSVPADPAIYVINNSCAHHEYLLSIEADGDMTSLVFSLVKDGLKIVDNGKLSSGQFKLDDGLLELHFSGGYYTSDQSLRFETEAVSLDISQISQAVDTLVSNKEPVEWVSVASELDPSAWSTLSLLADEQASLDNYLYFKVQSSLRDPSESGDAWTSRVVGLLSDGVKSPRLQVHCGAVKAAALDGSVKKEPLINFSSAASAARECSEPADAVKYGPLEGALSIDGNLSDGQLEALNDKQGVTPRQIIGLSGIYLTRSCMFTEPTSDFYIEERRRVMDTVSRKAYVAMLPYLNDTVVLDASGHISGADVAQMEGAVQDPLDIMIRQGEISDAKVQIDPNQDTAQTGEIHVEVQILPLGKLEFINVDLSYTTQIEG